MNDQTQVVQIDQEQLAYYLFERNFYRFNPEPEYEDVADESNREKFLKILLWPLVGSAVALMIMSAINTFPEFALRTPDYWADTALNVAAPLVSGGMAVIGVEIFIFTAAALMHIIPKELRKDNKTLSLSIAYTLALLLGAVANQDFLVREAKMSGAIDIWTLTTTIVFGVGRFALMVAAGHALAILITMQDGFKYRSRNQYDKRMSMWYQVKEDEWSDTKGKWSQQAKRMISSGQIPAEALSAGGVATVDPTPWSELSEQNLLTGSEEVLALQEPESV